MPESRVDIKTKLNSALRYALYTSVGGASNRIDDVIKSSGWVLNNSGRYDVTGEYRKHDNVQNQFTGEDKASNIQFNPHTHTRYHQKGQWYYHVSDRKKINEPIIELLCINSNEHPLSTNNLSAHNLDNKHFSLLCAAIFALEKRINNCGGRALLIAKYLWEHSEGIDRIELFSATTFDHAWVVVNRKEESILEEVDTWGEECWGIDGWYGEKGLIFPASEFKMQMKNIKAFAKKQREELKKINVSSNRPWSDNEELCGKPEYQIKPGIHKYPYLINAAIKEQPVEFYYYLSNNYHPLQSINPDALHVNVGAYLLESLATHKRKFKKCMLELQNATSQNQEGFSVTKEPNRSSLSKALPTDLHKMGELLNKACFKGDTLLVEQLLEAGAFVNFQRKTDGATPLYIASSMGQMETVKSLIKWKANIDQARTVDGRTPLHSAFHNKHSEIFKLLLANGADINKMQARQGECLLHTACISGDLTGVNFLLGHGANPNIARDFGGQTPLFLVCESEQAQQLEMTRLLLTKADVNQARNTDGVTLLILACALGNTLLVKLLLESGANTERLTNSQLSALFVACDDGHYDIVEALINKGAPPNQRNDNNRTALYMACKNGHFRIAQFLLEHGADPTLTDNEQACPLHWACQNGDLSIAKQFLERKADVNLTTTDEVTPLHCACKSGNLQLIQLLVAKGALLEVKRNSDQATPLSIAVAEKHWPAIEFLINEGADTRNIDIQKLSLEEQERYTRLVNEKPVVSEVAPNNKRNTEVLHQKTALLTLLKKYLSNRESCTDSEGKTREYLHCSFFSFLQKSFTDKSNAVNALTRALNGNNVDLSTHLSTLNNGTLGNQLKDFISSGAANCLVQRKVKTVNDFVHALEDIVSNGTSKRRHVEDSLFSCFF